MRWWRRWRAQEDPVEARGAFVRALIARWEWRLIGSDEGQRAGRHGELALQATEELEAFIERERAGVAARAAAANVSAEAARDRVAAAAEQVPPEPAEVAPQLPPTNTSRYRIGIPTACLLTVTVVVLTVLATGAVVDLTASSTFVPLAAVTVLAAVMGGVAGASLTWERTPWAAGIAASVLSLGSAAAFLVAWVAGLALERRLLLAVLFVMLAAMSAAIWAFRALAAEPREKRTYQRREHRRFKKALEGRSARLSALAAARADLAEAEASAQRAEIELESFDKVTNAWRKELGYVGKRAMGR